MIRIARVLALLFFLMAWSAVSYAQSAPSGPFVVEYYYKAKWGHADEFLKLFKKNHYPVLKKEMELGRIAKVWMDQPRYHTTEDGRWDFRVTIAFKNATVANEPFDEAAVQKQLYPDQETFQREEQRRFPQGHPQTWTGWWEAIAADPELAGLAARRERLQLDSEHHGSPSGWLSTHVEALRAAGFSEVGTLWQRGNNRILCGVRGG